MPIYEFYCDSCNVVYNFLSTRIDTTTKPDCPKCGRRELPRQISEFATLRATDQSDEQLAGLDESTMEKAFSSLLDKTEGIDENDPRQMARVMREFTRQTGLNLGDAMDEAVSRMEAGEDPETIEQEMGDQLDGDDIGFEMVNKKTAPQKAKPVQDSKLYRL